jgi:hypothetical protein
MLSIHLRCGLPNGLFPSGSPIITLHTLLFHFFDMGFENNYICSTTRTYAMRLKHVV